MTLANGLIGTGSRDFNPLMFVGGYYRLNPVISLNKDAEKRLRMNNAIGFGVF